MILDTVFKNPTKAIQKESTKSFLNWYGTEKLDDDVNKNYSATA